LGVFDWKINVLQIYPNPVRNNQFTIAVPDQISSAVTVEICNLIGQSIYKVTTGVVNNEITIQPLVALNKGVYIVSMKNEGAVFTQKISVP
jgi:hypothetical protein